MLALLGTAYKAWKQDEGWGEPVLGEQIRAVAERDVWTEGETPILIADGRNSGFLDFLLSGTYFQAALEVDGVWHRWTGPADYPVPYPPYPRDSYGVKIWVYPNSGWSGIDDPSQHPRLTPGKHTIRVALPGSASDISSYRAIHAASPPIVLTIKPKGATSETPKKDDGQASLLTEKKRRLVVRAIELEPLTARSAGQTSDQMIAFDLSDPSNVVQLGTVNVNEAPWHPTYTPDGKYVYVGNLGANTVTMLDAERREILDIIRGNGFAEPHGSAVSPDGKYIYISNRNSKNGYRPRYNLGDNDNVGTVVVIDVATNQIAKVLEVGDFAAGLGVRPRDPGCCASPPSPFPCCCQRRFRWWE